MKRPCLAETFPPAARITGWDETATPAHFGIDAPRGFEQHEPGMEADEISITLYLKSYPGQFVSAAEICRRAGTKSRYRKQPDWAVPLLKRMTEAGLLESDATGHYRLVRNPEKEKKRRRWVSPQVARILKQSGRTFDIVSPEEDTGDTSQHYRD